VINILFEIITLLKVILCTVNYKGQDQKVYPVNLYVRKEISFHYSHILYSIQNIKLTVLYFKKFSLMKTSRGRSMEIMQYTFKNKESYLKVNIIIC